MFYHRITIKRLKLLLVKTFLANLIRYLRFIRLFQNEFYNNIFYKKNSESRFSFSLKNHVCNTSC